MEIYIYNSVDICSYIILALVNDPSMWYCCEVAENHITG